jgi:hypothetical protein
MPGRFRAVIVIGLAWPCCRAVDRPRRYRISTRSRRRGSRRRTCRASQQRLLAAERPPRNTSIGQGRMPITDERQRPYPADALKPADGLDYTLYRAAAGIYAWPSWRVSAIRKRRSRGSPARAGTPRRRAHPGVAQTHPANRSPRAQPPGGTNTGRCGSIISTGWGLVAVGQARFETRYQVALVLEHDADLYNREPAPAQLRRTRRRKQRLTAAAWR